MNEYGNPVSLKAHRGGMLLAFGILSLVCCFIFGIVAWVMGNNDLREMAAGRMDPSGEGLTKAGKIVGIIGCVLGILMILGWLAMMIFGVAMAGLSGVR